MTSISTAGHADASAAPKAKSRNLSLDRARTFLTLVVLLHHAVIPYTYFGHTDPKYILRLRHDRARHRQFLHGDVLFPVGAVRLVRDRPEGTAELSDRSPASAWPAVRDLRVHGHSARLLRDLAAAPSRDRLFGILVDHDHERPVAERTDLVSLGLVRLRPGCLPPVSAVTQHARSDQSPLAVWPPSARGVLRGHACRHRCVLRSWTDVFTDQAAGSSSGRSRSSTAA